MVLVLVATPDVLGGTDTRKSTKVADQVSLIEIAASGRQYPPTRALLLRRDRECLLKPLQAAIKLRGHPDLCTKQLDEPPGREPSALGDPSDRLFVRHGLKLSDGVRDRRMPSRRLEEPSTQCLLEDLESRAGSIRSPQTIMQLIRTFSPQILKWQV
jgi:hypothetical protein